MEVPLWVRHFRSICRDTGLRDTGEREIQVPKKQKTPRNGQRNVPGGEKNELRSGSTSKTSYTASDSFDSPVIYGVRVETPNPYHLLISKRYIQNGRFRPDDGILSGLRAKVKPKIERFTHFLLEIFVQFEQLKFHILNRTETIPKTYERGRIGRGTLDKTGCVLLNTKRSGKKVPDESVKKETGKRRQP